MYDVITLGSSTVDVFVSTKSKQVSVEKGRLYYPEGAKLLVDELNITVGGGATNSAVCFSRLRNKTACISKMGTKNNSDRIVELLEKEKVDTSLICQCKGRTGFSIILDAKGNDRTILVFKGSNNDLKSRDVKWRQLKTKWFYCGSMMGTSFETFKKILILAEKKGIKVAFNPSSYVAKMGLRKLSSVLKRVDVLILNKEEAHMLTKQKTINQMLKAIHKAGPKIAAITNGKEGVYVCDGETKYFLKAHKLKIAETTGAGDAFGATFISGLIKNQDIETAMRMGLSNSESVIRHYGAKEKLLNSREIMKAIQEKPGIIKKTKIC